MDYDFHSIYMTWIWHGEEEAYPAPSVQSLSSSKPIDEMADVLMDLTNEVVTCDGDEDDGNKHIDEWSSKYEILFYELQVERGCKKISALNFMVKLMHIKVLNK